MNENYAPPQESSPNSESITETTVVAETSLISTIPTDRELDAFAQESEAENQIQKIRNELGIPVVNAGTNDITQETSVIDEGRIDPEQTSDFRAELLSGTLSPEQFLANVFASDQEDQMHQNAKKNLSLLNDPEVVGLLSSNAEYKDEYQNARSLAAFHVAQQRLGSGDIAGAAPFLEMANSAATDVMWENYGGWQNYVKATIAYTKGDIAELSKIYNELPAGDSYREVIERLKSGLETGAVDYLRDYRGG